MTYGKRPLLGVAAAVIAATVVAGASAGNGHGSSGGQPSAHGQQQSGRGQTQPGNGVKPGSSTGHDTWAAAGSSSTKEYGNGRTAGQIAQRHGAGPSTELYGPGNSQPHMVGACSANGRTHMVDVHALKSRHSGSCEAQLHASGGTQGERSSQQPAGATAAASGHVEICHATGNGGYVLISPDVSGVFHGHFREHGRDIVPPFSYGGHTYSLNWTSEGQALWRNGCKASVGSSTGGASGNGSPPSTPSSSSSSSGVSAAGRSAQGSPRLLVHKQERVGAAGAFSDGPVNAQVGETVFYEILVNDDGDTPLDVTLSDPRCDAGTIVPNATKPIELNPQGTVYYTCSHVLTAADVGTFTNVVTATGTIPGTTSWVQGQSGVVAHVGASGVRGASKTLKKVTKRARPAAKKAAVKAASFTG